MAELLSGVADRLYGALSVAMEDTTAAEVIKATLEGSAWVWCAFGNARVPKVLASCAQLSCSSAALHGLLSTHKLAALGADPKHLHCVLHAALLLLAALAANAVLAFVCRVGDGFALRAAAALQGSPDSAAPLRVVPPDLVQRHGELLLGLGVRSDSVQH